MGRVRFGRGRLTGPLRTQRSLLRAGVAAAFGLSAAAALSVARVAPSVVALVGWDAGALALLGLAWLSIARAPAALTRERAAAEDPGRTAVYALVLFTSGSSLLSTVALVHRAKEVSGPRSDALVALCLANVALSWALTHTAFTLRYAHLYYREDDEGVGGVEFPGKAAPTYFDFAYFAFTIGMCFQVSDVAVTSPRIRRSVLLHALLSFVYNTAILAFVLNLLFGLAS